MLNQQLPHYYDRTNNINGVGTLAQGPTDPDGYGRERMHDETVLDKMRKRTYVNTDKKSYHRRLGEMISKVKAETKWKDIFKVVDKAQKRLKNEEKY